MSCSGGLEHRKLASVKAIGVDEIAYGRGHQYLTLVYQIESGCTRLLWVGKERTSESFERFFAMIGQELARQPKRARQDAGLSAGRPATSSSPW